MSHLNSPVSITWEMDSIFQGGSSSEAFSSFLAKLEDDIRSLHEKLTRLASLQNQQHLEELRLVIDGLQDAEARYVEAASFVSCISAENQHDKKAVQLSGKVTTIEAAYSNTLTLFESSLRNIPEDLWKQWLSSEEIAPIAFVLNEKREAALDKLSPELESLASDLAINGYHGWGQHYDTIVSKVSVPVVNEQGETEWLSVGQAANKLTDPNRNVREQTFVSWEKAWEDVADYCADTLNGLSGFRIKLYEKRGWHDVLHEPLKISRMSRETLDMMWKVIEDNKPIFVHYMERKAKLMGLEKLSWCDVDAPFGADAGKVSYEVAAEEIMKQFRLFSPKLADFTLEAFNKRWIEAEDRPGKRPGGFCTSFPVSHQTRIFMTYGGTVSSMSTLAHELGHAYHQFLMDDLPQFNQNYAMNVAETASTFAEMIVADALVKKAETKEQKISLLADKVQSSISFFMNIHARFLFETRFYEKRKEGTLNAEELNVLMEEAQREAFLGALGSYHPHFWASKLHFYITDVPFYNFPYTFGYMFSTGLYARAQLEGESFAAKYDALLEDTGRMTVEELAKKHLDVDLTKPDFWQEAMNLAVADVKLFLELTE